MACVGEKDMGLLRSHLGLIRHFHAAEDFDESGKKTDTRDYSAILNWPIIENTYSVSSLSLYYTSDGVTSTSIIVEKN